MAQESQHSELRRMTREFQNLYLTVFCKMRNILLENRIHYWLDSGTLLGICRDGDLRCEHDFDIGTYAEYWDKVLNLSAKILKSVPYKIATRWEVHPYYIQSLRFCHSNQVKSLEEYARIDIMFWHKVGSWRTFPGLKFLYSLPEELFVEFEEKSFVNIPEFANEKFIIPKRWKEYLEWIYGKGWTIPMPSEEFHRFLKMQAENLIERVPGAVQRPAVVEYWREGYNTEKWRKYVVI